MKASKVMNMRHISSVSFPSFNGVHNHNTTATSQEHYFYRIPWSPSHSAQVIILPISSRETTLISINITNDKEFHVVPI